MRYQELETAIPVAPGRMKDTERGEPRYKHVVGINGLLVAEDAPNGVGVTLNGRLVPWNHVRYADPLPEKPPEIPTTDKRLVMPPLPELPAAKPKAKTAKR